MTTVCCKCHRAKHREGWSECPAAPNQKLSHGYCPECYQEAMAMIRRHLRRQAEGVPLF